MSGFAPVSPGVGVRGQHAIARKPLVVYPKTPLAWTAADFRRRWREVADAAWVPKSIW